MSTAFMPACVLGDTTIRASTTAGASTPAMKMATVFMKSMSIRWKGSGRCCAVGCARIGAFHKKNSRSTSGFSSSFTTCESEAKRCWVRSLNCSSAKTPESNKSELELLGQAIYRLRKCTVEPVFGIIKEVLGFRQFSLRGWEAAAGEWCLVCLAFNLKRLHVLFAD